MIDATDDMVYYILAFVERGSLPFRSALIFLLNSLLLSDSRIISSASHGSNLSSSIVLRRGLLFIPGLPLMLGLPLKPGLTRAGLDLTTPILVTGVVGTALPREIVFRGLSATGDSSLASFAYVLLSNVETLVDKSCNLDNTLFVTR
jgi:hypothetical protein